ncbi:MAG: hypothetical protein F4Y96_02125, partial [Chloroflexi bacterium]|nr:hypothetical protein [Chloroflexota bacterium]
MATTGERDFRFGLTANAVDFLGAAAQEMASEGGKNLKYATLHLVDGIELLLMARLAKESWYLLFPDIDKADEAMLDKGDFQSVGLDTTLSRLENLAKVQLSDADIKVIKGLRTIRN